jgi:hypothetical protein
MKLKEAVCEKDVENAYRGEIARLRPKAVWSSPFSTDGVAEWEAKGPPPTTVRLLLEFKYDRELKNRTAACSILGQLLLYVKRWEETGTPMPNVLLVGDKNECFVLATDAVKGFLDLKIDWSVAPSTGSPELTRALVEGVNILPFVHDIESAPDFAPVIDRIEALAAGKQVSVRASTLNLGAIFEYWLDRVFKGGRAKATLTPVQLADVFLKSLFHPEDVYLHPVRKDTLVVPGYKDGVLVNADQYNSFFQHFQQGYKPSEIRVFMAMKDQLIEDDARRRQGAFFTPALWAAEGQEEVSRVLGENWREECVVWDCAAGTGNLTRDYNGWGCLISSTLEQTDVDAMKDHGWGGHHVFRYDFLNDASFGPPGVALGEDGQVQGEGTFIPRDIEATLREKAKAGKRLVFFINPPYAEDGQAGAKGETKAGVAKDTVAAAACRAAKFGRVSRQLYAQFMYQCQSVARKFGFVDYTVALYSKPTFMSSGSYREFRNWWYHRHDFGGGFLFQASQFADVSGAWGISFTVWHSTDAGMRGCACRPDVEQPMTKLRVCEIEQFAVQTVDEKIVYHVDDREASEWVEGKQNTTGGVDGPKFSSGLSVREAWDGKSVPGSLGVLCSMGNNVMEAGTSTFYLSGRPTHKGRRHFDLLPSNWHRAVALYAARKLVTGNWLNDKDEYAAPDETKDGYKQWVDDCHVFALLDTANNCTAMRDVEYKGKKWQIDNHWFWLTRDEATEALDDRKTQRIYADVVRTKPSNQTASGGESKHPDPYFARLLASGEVKLSPDAAELLADLIALWKDSLPYREHYYDSREVRDGDGRGKGEAKAQPDLHLLAWDAGHYQLKHLWRDLFADRYKAIKAKHKALAERLREGVYEYGFLRK